MPSITQPTAVWKCLGAQIRSVVHFLFHQRDISLLWNKDVPAKILRKNLWPMVVGGFIVQNFLKIYQKTPWNELCSNPVSNPKNNLSLRNVSFCNQKFQVFLNAECARHFVWGHLVCQRIVRFAQKPAQNDRQHPNSSKTNFHCPKLWHSKVTFSQRNSTSSLAISWQTTSQNIIN